MQAYDATPAWVAGLRGAAQSAAGRKKRAQDAEKHRAAMSDFQYKLTVQQMDLGRRQAQAELHGWQLAATPQNGSTGISDVVEGRAGMGTGGAPPPEVYQAIAEAARGLDGKSRDFVLGYVDTKMQGAIRQRRLQEAQGAIQQAMQPGVNGEEPILLPEQAQAMLNDLEDATKADVTPEAIQDLLRDQRQQLAVAGAKAIVIQRTSASIEQMLTDGPETERLKNLFDISPREWDRRVAKATMKWQEYLQFADQVEPQKAVEEISQILYAQGEDPIKIRRNALEHAQKDPLWRTPPEGVDPFVYREKLVTQYENLIRGGDGSEGMGDQTGAPGEQDQVSDETIDQVAHARTMGNTPPEKIERMFLQGVKWTPELEQRVIARMQEMAAEGGPSFGDRASAKYDEKYGAPGSQAPQRLRAARSEGGPAGIDSPKPRTLPDGTQPYSTSFEEPPPVSVEEAVRSSGPKPAERRAARGNEGAGTVRVPKAAKKAPGPIKDQGLRTSKKGERLRMDLAPKRRLQIFGWKESEEPNPAKWIREKLKETLPKVTAEELKATLAELEG